MDFERGLPEDVRKLNESVWELYAPHGTPEVQIFFFHGLQLGSSSEAFWRTWSGDRGKTGWPRTLLAERRLVNARILSISYDSSAQKSLSKRGNMDLACTAENLVYDIILSDQAFADEYRSLPVILVGHSLGGLVIKQFVLMAQKYRNAWTTGRKARDKQCIDNFLTNLCGIFYYGTPHQGSELAYIARFTRGNSHALSFLIALSKHRSRLNDDFRGWRTRHKIPTFSIAEGLPIFGIWRFGVTVVKEASVMFDSDYRYVAWKNHSAICKHTEMTDSSFRHLVQFIKDTVKEKYQTYTITDVLGRSSQEPGSSCSLSHRRRINDSLYELYAPRVPDEPEVDIVFFHGVQLGDYRDAYWKTWSSDGETVWPRTFLGERCLTKARILAVSYDSSCIVTPTSGRGDSYTIAQNLLADVILWEIESVGVGRRPVILVGYGLGGLVIHELLLMADKGRNDLHPIQNKRERAQIEKIDNFLSNVRGLLYYSAPWLGSRVVNKLPGTSHWLRYLAFGSKEIYRLQNDFQMWDRNHNIPSIAICEGIPSKRAGFWGTKVEHPFGEERPVRECLHRLVTIPKDHFQVCKASSMTDQTFVLLLDFVRENLEGYEITDLYRKPDAPKMEDVRKLLGGPPNTTKILGGLWRKLRFYFCALLFDLPWGCGSHMHHLRGHNTF